MKSIKLEDIWTVEQDILDVIDKVCKENNLRYSLACGTLLGAVRHKGFIPWDDDLDIMMPREDYNKLKELWGNAAPTGYILQNEDDDYGPVNNFTKIRKEHTTFIMYEVELAEQYHKGIYVDIFPVDRVAPGKIKRTIQYYLFALSLLFNRGYLSGTGGITGYAERILLKIVPQKDYRRISKWLGRKSRRWNDYSQNQLVIPCRIINCKRYYPADLFDEFTELEFQGKKYSAVKKHNDVLIIRYGDYMQLPPKEEQVWKHHPFIVDFEHNYEELDNKVRV